MPIQVQRRGGTTAEHNEFVGAAKEVTIDTDKHVCVIHDGQTPGGYSMLRQDGDNEKRPDQQSEQNWKIVIIDGVLALKEV